MRSNGHTCKIIHMVTIPYISFYTVLPHTAFQFLRNESSWLCRECARAHWDWEMRMIIFDDCYGGSLMFSFVWVIASPLSTASVQWDCLSASRCCCCYCHCSRCCCTELYSTHSYSKKKTNNIVIAFDGKTKSGNEILSRFPFLLLQNSCHMQFFMCLTRTFITFSLAKVIQIENGYVWNEIWNVWPIRISRFSQI